MRNIFGIRNKILAAMITVCFIPFICFSIFVYHNYSNYLERNTIQNALHETEQNDKIVFFNIWMIEYATERICEDKEFQRIFVENADEKTYIKYMSEAVKEFPSVKGVTSFSSSGKKYEYGYSTGKKDKVDFILGNGRNAMSDGHMNWSGQDKEMLTAGMILSDDEGNELGRVFFLVSNEIFDDIMPIKDDENVFVCDENGVVIISDDDGLAPNDNLWNYSIELNNFIYNSESNNCYVELGGESYIAVKYKSQFMGWYFVKIVKSVEFMRNVRLITTVSLVIGLCALIVIFLIYMFIIRRLFKPVGDIDRAMRSVVSDDFNIKLDIHTNDEFAIIGKGFNRMVDEIKKLVNDMQKSNDEKIKLEIETLQYQINPHFLYNILAAVRFTALKKGETDVADMLLKLNRLFRMKLKDAGKDVTLYDDINTMKDYVDLLNLRYDNGIDFIFDISEDSKYCRIPGLILQPLIENAVTHGVAARVRNKEKAEVKITSRLEDDVLKISVYDNGVGMDNETVQRLVNGSETETESIGFANVRKRLRYHYGDDLRVDIDSAKNEYTNVIISIKNHKIS